MKSWVKLYTEIVDDPDMSELTWAHKGIWSALLAAAGRLDHRDKDDNETGRLNTPEKTAWYIRCDLDEFKEAAKAFESLGMIDEREGILFVTNYNKRQARPPSASKEAVKARVSKHRDKVKREGNDVTREAKQNVTPLDKKEKKDSDTDSENFKCYEFIKFFEELTKIPEPSPKTKYGKRERDEWWEAAIEALSIAGGDLERAKFLAKNAFVHCVEQELTLVGPKSLLKTMRSVAGGIVKGSMRSETQDFLNELRGDQ